MSVMFCRRCETTWLGEYTGRCWSCGVEGQPGRLPPRAAPSGMGLTVTHFETLPDPDEGDAFWCGDCREAKRAYAASNVRQRAHGKAEHLAAAWVRAHHRDVWERLLAEAVAYFEGTT